MRVRSSNAGCTSNERGEASRVRAAYWAIQLVKELAPPSVANPAPVFSGRATGDPLQVNGGTQAPNSDGLQPPRLVYRGPNRRRVSQEPVERVTGIIPQLGDPRNHLREESCAWPHSDRNRGGVCTPLPRTEAVRSQEHPQALAANDTLQQIGSLASLLGVGKASGITDGSANSLVPCWHADPSGQWQ